MAQPAAPTPPASSPPPPAVSAGPPNPAWQSAVSAWLQAHKTYPERALLRGDQGEVRISFTVTRNGRVTSATIARGSGSEVLDRAALALVREAKLPAFPPGMAQDETTLVLTIGYRFED